MKLLLIALTIAASFFSKSTLANEVNVTPVVEEAFHNSFGQATSVKWSNLGNLYKAEFLIRNEKVSVFFNQEGESVAIAHYLSISQLSKELQSDLMKKAENYSIMEIFEVSNDEGTTYYATIENKQNLVVISANHKNWNVFKRTIKG